MLSRTLDQTESCWNDNSSFPLSLIAFFVLSLLMSSTHCLYFPLLSSLTKFYISIFAQALKPCRVASKQYHMWHVTIPSCCCVPVYFQLRSNLCTVTCTVCMHGSTQDSTRLAEIHDRPAECVSRPGPKKTKSRLRPEQKSMAAWPYFPTPNNTACSQKFAL